MFIHGLELLILGSRRRRGGLQLRRHRRIFRRSLSCRGPFVSFSSSSPPWQVSGVWFCQAQGFTAHAVGKRVAGPTKPPGVRVFVQGAYTPPTVLYGSQRLGNRLGLGSKWAPVGMGPEGGLPLRPPGMDSRAMRTRSLSCKCA